MSLRSLAFLLVAAACTGGPTDKTIQSKNVTQTTGPKEDYEYIAKRSRSVTGLAEGRGLDPEFARRAMDKLADAVDRCVKTEEAQGRMTPGAVRVVAAIDDGGSVGTPRITLSAASAGTIALLCVVANVRMLVFPLASGDAGARGLAVEATWGD